MRKIRQAHRRGGHKTKARRKHNTTGFIESCQRSFMRSNRLFTGETGCKLCVKCKRFQESPTTWTGSRPVWPQIFHRVCGLLCFYGPTGMQSPGVAAVSRSTHSVHTALRVGPCGLCNRIMSFDNCQRQLLSLFRMLTAA